MFRFSYSLYFFVFLLLLLNCTPREKEFTDFETVEKNEAFRKQIHTGDFAKLSDGYTYYEYENQDADTLIVMVHGFSVPSYIWDSTYNATLKKGYGVLRYDVYGRGYSDSPDVVYDVALYSNQLKELLETLGIEKKINLMGLSYGGRIVSAFASQYPVWIQNLIYVDPAGFETITDSTGYPAFVTEEEVEAFKKSDYYSGMAKGQLSDFYDSTRFRGWDDRYKEMMKYKGLVRALISTRKNSPSMEAEHRRIATFDYPVFCIWGKYDTVVPLENVRSNLHDRIPRLKLYEIPDAGHLPNMEQTALFNSILFDQIIKGKAE